MVCPSEARRSRTRSSTSTCPIHDRRGGSVVGVAEVELDYADTEAALAHSVRIVAYVVVAGLGLLWLLLFRTVWNASRTLRRQAAETARLALLDPLTGLPNRRLLNERLERAAAASARTGDSVGLILLDIDRFKEVNDTLGHPRGDELLVEVADRLKEVVRDTDTVARLGGDEFAVLLPPTGGVAEAAMIAGRVQGVFSQPFDLDGLILHVDTSVGLRGPPRARRRRHLAAAARRRRDVHREGRRRAARPSTPPPATINSPNRLVLLGDLRRALDNDDRAVHALPAQDRPAHRRGAAVSRRCCAGSTRCAASSRPASSSRSPSRPASSSRSRAACSRMVAAPDRRVGAPRVSGSRSRSTSPRATSLEPDLESSRHRPARRVRHRRRAHRVRDHRVRDRRGPGAGAARCCTELTALGIGVAVDDFGIGNTSMSQLRSMPLRTLKIDRSFVTDLVTDAGRRRAGQGDRRARPRVQPDRGGRGRRGARRSPSGSASSAATSPRASSGPEPVSGDRAPTRSSRASRARAPDRRAAQSPTPHVGTLGSVIDLRLLRETPRPCVLRSGLAASRSTWSTPCSLPTRPVAAAGTASTRCAASRRRSAARSRRRPGTRRRRCSPMPRTWRPR